MKRHVHILLVLTVSAAILGGCSLNPRSSARSASPGNAQDTNVASKTMKLERVPSSADRPSVEVKGDAFDEPGPGVPLDQALRAMGGAVRLPSSSDVGTVSKVLLEQFDSPDGKQSVMAVLYTWGVWVSVEERRDLEPAFRKLETFEADGEVKFTDGKRHNMIEEPPSRERAGNGVQAVSVEEGTQVMADGSKNRVPAMISWNDGAFTYTMKAREDKFGLAELRGFMKSAR